MALVVGLLLHHLFVEASVPPVWSFPAYLELDLYVLSTTAVSPSGLRWRAIRNLSETGQSRVM